MEEKLKQKESLIEQESKKQLANQKKELEN